MVQFSSFRLFFIAAFLSALLIGCGGSEEAVAEDELITDTGFEEDLPPADDEGVIEEEAPSEELVEEPMAEEPLPADSSVEEQQPVQEQPAVQEGPTKEQLQSELDAIKTENMQLKDENIALQQTNKDFSNKISDLEAANAALASAQRKPEPMAVNRSASAPGKSTMEEIRAYEGAVGMTRSRNYRGAISELQQLLANGIKDDYADNCHYWLGESNFHLREYSQAIQHFQHVQGYKYSEKNDDAQLMIARSYELLGDRSRARSEYQKLVEMYPTSEYVRRARAKLR